MADAITIGSYDRRTAETVQHALRTALADSWLASYSEQIFHICDELIKNALKSNYKFLLIWRYTRERLLEAHPDFSASDADEWLREVFYSGENDLIERHVSRLPARHSLGAELRRLLDLENLFLERVAEGALAPLPPTELYPETGAELGPLYAIKNLARQLQVQVHFRIERSLDQALITVANDSPILEEDFLRIRQVRRKFRTYCEEERVDEFFIENLDTSGGGHGLGYAIMDAILLELNLDPDHSLYLISASRTMVLLALPLTRPAARAL